MEMLAEEIKEMEKALMEKKKEFSEKGTNEKKGKKFVKLFFKLLVLFTLNKKNNKKGKNNSN